MGMRGAAASVAIGLKVGSTVATIGSRSRAGAASAATEGTPATGLPLAARVECRAERNSSPSTIGRTLDKSSNGTGSDCVFVVGLRRVAAPLFRAHSGAPLQAKNDWISENDPPMKTLHGGAQAVAPLAHAQAVQGDC